mmetsp:Transcript_42938/g.103812  ORF Transcript_42938/g.103812 Transcript_42938/m.103812 type:complete len:138 (+) Transcript_42938:621-1034(+)
MAGIDAEEDRSLSIDLDGEMEGDQRSSTLSSDPVVTEGENGEDEGGGGMNCLLWRPRCGIRAVSETIFHEAVETPVDFCSSDCPERRLLFADDDDDDDSDPDKSTSSSSSSSSMVEVINERLVRVKGLSLSSSSRNI